MNVPENDYQILKLTDAFYKAYPNPPYTEILKKNQRAYNCLLFQSHYDYFICIPYRSEITHKYAYHFTSTERAKLHKSGLEYSKIVIIEKLEYIDSVSAIIDKDEVLKTPYIGNSKKIKFFLISLQHFMPLICVYSEKANEPKKINQYGGN